MQLSKFYSRVESTFSKHSRIYREGNDLTHFKWKDTNYHLGPMREVSLVGSKGEEAGANFSEYNRLLETKIPLLQHILPWGAMSVIKDAKQSDDGPIWWVRPGEQR